MFVMNIAKMDLGMFLFLRGSTRENSRARDLCIVKLDFLIYSAVSNVAISL